MTYKRNEEGLLTGVDYKFNDDGSVDWRAMIDPKHLYPNKGWFESRGEPMPRSSEGLGRKWNRVQLGRFHRRIVAFRF